jgi:hypothetical protein
VLQRVTRRGQRGIPLFHIDEARPTCHRHCLRSSASVKQLRASAAEFRCVCLARCAWRSPGVLHCFLLHLAGCHTSGSGVITALGMHFRQPVLQCTKKSGFVQVKRNIFLLSRQ